MSITMRIIQQFDVRYEAEFMILERQFADLERTRSNFPKGRRLQPIAAAEACHTLIWEAEFADLDAAHKALDFFAGDDDHEKLLAQQRPFFQQVKIEFLNNLDF